jgi:hypothetical protein
MPSQTDSALAHGAASNRALSGRSKIRFARLGPPSCRTLDATNSLPQRLNSMSTGAILTVLSNIPWGQVVENAPKVADGAAKLWSSVTGFRKKSASASSPTGSTGTPALTETEVLRAQVQALEEAVKSLTDQMQASSELIKALADQNTQLVQTVESNRVRLYRLAVVAAVAGVVLFAAIAFLVVGR